MTNFLDRGAGIVEQVPVKTLHLIQSDVVLSSVGYKTGETTDYVKIGELRRHIK